MNRITNKTKAAFRTIDEREVYAQELIRIVLGLRRDQLGIPATTVGCFSIINATEAQRSLAFKRAKAFLKETAAMNRPKAKL